MKRFDKNISGGSQPRIHYAFVILLCCCLMMGVNVGLTFSCAGIFYTPLTSDLGFSVGAFGLYMTAMYVTSTLTLPLAGYLLKRFSARYVFTAASLLNGVALMLMGMMSHLWGFYLIGGLLGVSIAFLLYMSYPTMISRWFHSRMGLMIGICCAASGLGGIIFNPIGAAVINAYGWRAGYYLFGAIVILVVTPLLAWLLRDNPRDLGLQKYGIAEDTASVAVAENGVSLKQASRSAIFYVIILFAFIMMGCSTLNLFIPGFAQGKGFSLEQASLLASASMLGVTLGKLLLGYINDRNVTLGVTLSTLGGALGIMMLLLSHSSLWPMLLGSFFFGWCYAGVTVQTAMLTRKVMGNKDYAAIFAIVSIALSAGGAVASGGWGLIADAVGVGVSFSIGVGLLILAFILGIVALRAAKSPREENIPSLNCSNNEVV